LIALDLDRRRRVPDRQSHGNRLEGVPGPKGVPPQSAHPLIATMSASSAQTTATHSAVLAIRSSARSSSCRQPPHPKHLIARERRHRHRIGLIAREQMEPARIEAVKQPDMARRLRAPLDPAADRRRV
jgi:hypothetical protein